MSASASQGLRTCPLLPPVEICSDSRRTSLFHGVSYSVPLRACCSVTIILDTPVNNSGFRISNGKVHRPGCPFDAGPGKIKLWGHLLLLFSSLFRSTHSVVTSNALPAPFGGLWQFRDQLWNLPPLVQSPATLPTTRTYQANLGACNLK